MSCPLPSTLSLSNNTTNSCESSFPNRPFVWRHSSHSCERLCMYKTLAHKGKIANGHIGSRSGRTPGFIFLWLVCVEEPFFFAFCLFSKSVFIWYFICLSSSLSNTFPVAFFFSTQLFFSTLRRSFVHRIENTERMCGEYSYCYFYFYDHGSLARCLSCFSLYSWFVFFLYFSLLIGV